MKHDQSSITRQGLGKGRLYHVHLQHLGWYCGLQGWKERAFKIVVTRSNDYLGGVVRGRSVLAEDLRRSWVSCLLPAPASILPEKFQHCYPSSKIFPMTGKKEIDCVLKSYLENTKGALFQNGLRGLGALGGKSWTYTITLSNYAWCYSCCHVGYYKASCQLVSLKTKTKLLRLPGLFPSPSPPPSTLPQTVSSLGGPHIRKRCQETWGQKLPPVSTSEETTTGLVL